ncbi:MAG: hypothetical protein UDS45_06210 [Lachnospiraceae bacterium]|jgi:hypothetical protein|nr:hypothetical protein [Lachnospiraceae bacterium]
MSNIHWLKKNKICYIVVDSVFALSTIFVQAAIQSFLLYGKLEIALANLKN